MSEVKSSTEITATLVASFGTEGFGPGQFQYVHDVRVSPFDNTVWVVSKLRVQVFSPDFKFLRRFGKEGREAGQICNPHGIAFDSNGTVLVSEGDPVHRVQLFKHDGTYLRQIGRGGKGTENGQFNEPWAVAVDGKGLIFVADSNNNRIQIFNREGSFFNRTGFVRAFGKEGSGDGEFDHPTGIAISPTGELVVTDSLNHRIQAEGNFIRKLGSTGSGNGQFIWPRSVCFDRSGRLLVADTNNHRVQVLSWEGKFIAAFGSFGKGDSQFTCPCATCVDGSGRVLVVDCNNSRVQIFTLTLNQDTPQSLPSTTASTATPTTTPTAPTTIATATTTTATAATTRAAQIKPTDATATELPAARAVAVAVAVADVDLDKLVAERLAKEKATIELKQREMDAKEAKARADVEKAERERQAAETKAQQAEKERQRLETEKKSGLSASVTEVKYDELEFIEEIGGGGFGLVWLGTWRPMGSEKIAIKKLHATSLSEEAMQQLRGEVEVMQVIELCIRGSLFAVLHSKTPLSFELRVRLMLESARGLSLLHSKNIIHRDIKSPNVLVTEEWHAKLGDFGMAKAKIETATTTKASKAMSLLWTAPELLTLRPKHTTASDVYAFGVMLFEIATRLTPYEGADDSTIRDLVKSGEREEIPAEAKVPKAKADLIARCWHQEPSKRPGMPEVVAELEKLLPADTHVLLPTADQHTALLHQILQETKQAKDYAAAASHHAASASDAGHRVEAAVNPSQLAGLKPVDHCMLC